MQSFWSVNQLCSHLEQLFAVNTVTRVQVIKNTILFKRNTFIDDGFLFVRPIAYKKVIIIFHPVFYSCIQLTILIWKEQILVTVILDVYTSNRS